MRMHDVERVLLTGPFMGVLPLVGAESTRT
jgi:hypothetical protein